MKGKIFSYRVQNNPVHGVTQMMIEIPLRDGASFVDKADSINNGDYTIEIKKPHKSKDMNSYMWVLCDKLAEKMPPLTKEDIYRECVKKAGRWVDMTVDAPDVNALELTWKKSGKIGWFIEKMHEADGRAYVRCYIGSSVYDHNELRKLTNYIVEECIQYGIETATPDELDHLECLWSVN